jgi:hypothetical protein
MCFGDRTVVLHASTDLSTIRVYAGGFSLDLRGGFTESEYSTEDVSNHAPFDRFRNSPLTNWWVLRNNQGYDDGIMLAFGYRAGLCFVAMNNELSVMVVEGEQFS